MLLMQNNLEHMIRTAAMTKREVAALKGITPENLSRQVNGHTNITLRDAEDYAKILDCLPEEIMFATKPIKLLADWRLDDNQQPYIDYESADDKVVFINQYYAKDTACIRAQLGPDKPWQFEMWDGQLEIIDFGPANRGEVSKECIQNPCYALSENGKLMWGLLYPQPGNVYTIYANSAKGFDNAENLKLKWACPVISVIRRPDLMGVRVVDQSKLGG